MTDNTKIPGAEELNYEVLLEQYSFNTYQNEDGSILKYFNELDDEEKKIVIYMLEGESIMRVANALKMQKKELKIKYQEILDKLKNMYLHGIF